MAVKIEGTCEARFERVREIFADSFVNGIEVGAAVAAVVDGKLAFIFGEAMQIRLRPGRGRAIRSSMSGRLPRGSRRFVHIGWSIRGSSILMLPSRSIGLSLRRLGKIRFR